MRSQETPVTTETLAVIDIGTNSVLLTVAAFDVHARKLGPRARSGAFELIEITRLGRGVDRNRTLEPEAVERTLACLRRYATEVELHGAQLVDIVGTSALRDARDGPAFLDQAAHVLGRRPRVLTGDEEAEATFEGALFGLPSRDHAPGGAPDALGGGMLVVDVGGGSTEVVLGSAAGRVSFRASADVGAVRLTERHVRRDPPAAVELEAIQRDAASALAALALPSLEGTRLVGVAGTLTTLAALDLGLASYQSERVHGHLLSASALESLTRALASETTAVRSQRPCLDPKRADVIVAGATILREVLALAAARGADPSGFVVSDGGVRWGLLAAAARAAAC